MDDTRKESRRVCEAAHPVVVSSGRSTAVGKECAGAANGLFYYYSTMSDSDEAATVVWVMDVANLKRRALESTEYGYEYSTGPGSRVCGSKSGEDPGRLNSFRPPAPLCMAPPSATATMVLRSDYSPRQHRAANIDTC